MMVEAGNTRFALVVTHAKKASATLSMLNTEKNEAACYDNQKDKTFQKQLINAVLGVVGDDSQSGITFYMTTDKDKVTFTKVGGPTMPSENQEQTREQKKAF